MKSIHAQRARRIMRALEEETGFSRDEIVGKVRTAAIKQVRLALIYLYRVELKLTFAEIAELVGRSRQHIHRFHEESRMEMVGDPLFAEFVRRVQKEINRTFGKEKK